MNVRLRIVHRNILESFCVIRERDGYSVVGLGGIEVYSGNYIVKVYELASSSPTPCKYRNHSTQQLRIDLVLWLW
jgi:hypothetical protein